MTKQLTQGQLWWRSLTPEQQQAYREKIQARKAETRTALIKPGQRRVMELAGDMNLPL